jgi:transposase
MTRLYARCRDGRRIAEATPGGHWKTVTLIGAIRLDGMFAPMTVEAATDANIFLAYVDQFLCPALQPGDIVVMDNLSSHKGQDIRDRIVLAGAEVFYLPHYSPDLNPIEKAWSKLKQFLRAAKARTPEQLQQAIAEALNEITKHDAAAWFRTPYYAI